MTAHDIDQDRAAEAREVALRLWAALPAFLVSGTAVCVATGAVIVLLGLTSPWTPMFLALAAGPLYAALVAQAADALQDVTPRAFSLPRAVRTSTRRAMSLLLPPAAFGTLTIVASFVARQSGSWLLMIPVAVGISATVLLLVAALTGLPLGAARTDLRGLRLTVAALSVAGRRPVAVAGTIAVFVIVAWACSAFSGTLVFFLPALVAVASAVAVAPHLGARPEAADFLTSERVR